MPAVFQLNSGNFRSNSGISAMPFGSPFCPNLTAKLPEFLYEKCPKQGGLAPPLATPPRSYAYAYNVGKILSFFTKVRHTVLVSFSNKVFTKTAAKN